MRRIIKSLNNDTGSIYIEFLVGIFFLIVILVLIISVFSVFSIKNKLDNANEMLLQQAELAGSTDLSSSIDQLRTQTGIDFAVSFEGTEYIPGSSHKVQLGQEIHITLSYASKIGAGDLFSAPINIRSSFVGLSQRFHK